MRLLGVDFGFARIGIAVGETEVEIATPRLALKASGALKTDARTIADLAIKEEAGIIVIGLPIEPTGEEGRMARICRTLGGHLQDLGHRTAMVDERLTSVEAEASLREGGLKASERRRARDGEAAALILERYMANGETPLPPATRDEDA